MGIFSPPRARTTLLSDAAQPSAGQYDDLNRSPATTVDLRFSRIPGGGGFHHGYIVITDNITGKRWKSEGEPDGRILRNMLPGGNLRARFYENPSIDESDSLASRFQTDAPAEQMAGKLKNFSEKFDSKKIRYGYPAPPLYDVNGDTVDLPTHNSNFYVGAAWDDLTGALPDLPLGIAAPGWGDHRSPLRWPEQ